MISRNRYESQTGIKLSGEKCIICGWNAKDYNGNSLVVGAHVRPFESGPEFDKKDNIIALCPNHHAEYDGHAFTIDAKSKQIIHRDSHNPINGLYVGEKIAHIKDCYLAYNQYLFYEHNKATIPY